MRHNSNKTMGYAGKNMSVIVILSDQVSPLNLLASKLRIKRYTDIRLKGEKYGDSLSRSLAVLKKKHSTLVYTKTEGIPRLKDLAQFIKASGAAVTPQTRVLFLNLAYYITDAHTIDTIIQKMMLVEDSVHGTVNQGPMGWFCLPFSYISAHMSNPSAIVPSPSDHTIALDNYVINLQDPKVVLDLFASSFDTRHFNQIKHDDVFFIKTSNDHRKLQSEHHYLETVPTPLKPFFPHVGDFFSGSDISYYQIERIFAFNLSTLLIHNTLSPDVFNRVLSALTSYLNRCENRTDTKTHIKEVYHRYFIEKLRARFQTFQTLPCFEKINAYWLLYSGKSCEAYLNDVIADLDYVIQKGKGLSLGYSHGDLCFSNILFDVETGAMKLIDPRGKKQEDDVILPLHYDLAKLSHSLLGGYDYIMSGHADIHLSKTVDIQQEFNGISNYDEHLKYMFSKWVSTRCELTDLRLFEASLFFSMSPLHQNNPQCILSQWISGAKAYTYYRDHR